MKASILKKSLISMIDSKIPGMLLPPENVYSSSYGGDRGCVTKQLTEKRNLAIIN